LSLFVKICGVSTAAAIDAAAAAGADAVGFVFHPSSPRHIEPARAAALARRLPPGLRSVAVTLRARQAEVARILETFRPDAWQCDAEELAQLRLPTGVEKLAVLRGASAVAPLPPRIVFDAAVSGRGLRADWHCAAALARERELVLAGGLDAGNVAAAIARVRPFGVDVSSGVESAPGVKDGARILAFVAAARRAAEAIAA
jgi:phosphoribosylanthranilate isomerase